MECLQILAGERMHLLILLHLDYLHPCSEGNSCTLRTFTRQLAREAGFDLNWSVSNATGSIESAI